MLRLLINPHKCTRSGASDDFRCPKISMKNRHPQAIAPAVGTRNVFDSCLAKMKAAPSRP